MASSRRYKATLAVALSLLAGCLLFSLGAPVLAALLVDDVARGLLPPEYPDSELVRVSDRVVGPHTRMEQRVYHSTANTIQVLRFMEEYMPGFSRSQDVVLYSCYQNARKVRGLPYRFARLGYLPSPSAQVTFCPAQGGGTVIFMGTVWPEP